MILLWLASCPVAGPVMAGTVLEPAGASTTMGHFNTYDPIYVTDQSGLAAGYVNGETDYRTFTAATATVSGGSSFNSWFSAAGNTNGFFDFDLGGMFTIDSLALWNDPQSIGQGVNEFNLYADDNPNFTSPTLLGNFFAVEKPGNAANFGQVFDFAAVTASNVRMEIISNHGSTLTTGFVEGAFEAVPEPGMGAIAAVGGVATLFWRRRQHRR